MKIFISNLDPAWENKDLAQLASPYGQVISAQIAIDAFNGHSRGFGFIEMAEDDQAVKAIEALNNSEQNGRTISAVESKTPVRKGSYPVGSGIINTFRFRKQ